MDCTPICRLARHGDVVLSAVTREQLNEIQRFVKYFCGNGARVCDSFGRNAVHVATSCGKKDVLKWLIEQVQQEGDHGNDGIIGVRDSESGWTALHRSCFYGYLSCALLLVQFGANIYEKDSEGISPVQLLMLDSPRKAYSREPPSINGRKKQPVKKGTCVDISSWGRNTNFTLGHGDERERYIPEVIDVFARRVKISIRDVLICKFHSVILAENGSVWTCGHGQGGRLGHGHEKTILVPKKVDALANHTCVAIAAGQDHSAVLCENGNVFTFGLNNYHQMGHQPPLSQYLSPKQIQAKHLRDKTFVGIAAGKYHTILYTRKEVYSCGLNSGQLGHSKGDRTQILPRQVSALHLKDTCISTMACNDAAMACVTDGGDVHLMYEYTQRKVISKFSSISKLVIIGGRLDESHFKEVTEKKCTQVIIYGLYEDGKVFQWSQNDKCVRECHWSVRQALSVADIACGKNIHIVTAQGEVYFEEGLSASLKKPTKILPRNPNFASSCHALKQDEVIEISVTRVPHVHRAVKIVCDEHSQNFAVLQADPSIGCTITPKVTPPEMNEHLIALFENAQLEDNVHDIEIKVKGRNLAAHRLILAEGSDKFRSLIDDAEATLADGDDLPSGVPIVSLDDDDFELIGEMVEFLYTGSCTSVRPPEEENPCVGSEEEDELGIPNREERILNELAWICECVDFVALDDLQVPLSPAFDALRDEKDDVFSAREERPSKLRGRFTETIKDGMPERVARRKELLRVAKKYGIAEMVSSLRDVTNDRKMSHKRFNRKRFTEYYDVVIEAEDDVEYACHKCILVARLEYFYNMLTTSWMESSGGYVRLKMPIPSNILKVIIDFLYTDEAPTVEESQDLEFLGKVLTVADQLWIIRLKEICEAKMASLISLKNATEMLEFSSLYNADQLKNVCLEFICLNMSCLFEAGSLEFLSEDVLDELSKAYRKMIPAMAWRVLTPSDIHLSVPCPQPESQTKRKGSRSQRRSRASESDVDGHPGQQTDKRHEVEISEDKVEEEGDISSPELVEKAGKNAGSPEHVPGKVKEKYRVEQVGLWYHKDADIRLKPVSPTFVPNAGMTRVVSNPVPISRRRKDGEKQEKQSWASQSLSPQSSNLRAIMEQEKTRSMEEDSPINERKKEVKSPLSSKSRMSQKERKKLRMSLEEQPSAKKDINHQETSDNHLTKTSASPGTANPWKCCPNGRPAVSFRELLEEEETRVITAEERKSTLPKECTKSPRARNSDVGHKNTSNSAWQNGDLACSPPNNPIKFDKIQELQEQETVNRERSMKKPLSMIQIEDKAIEELLEHYGGRYNPCELIVVEREIRLETSPNWVTKLHKTA